MSFDVERDPPSANRGETTFMGVGYIPAILDVLEGHGVRATFFVTGRIAQDYRDTLREIDMRGHEVGVHGGYYHDGSMKGLSQEEQTEGIKGTVELIENATMKTPVGYRAPGHLMDATTLWALEDMGFIYDSSVVPGIAGYLLYHQSYSTPAHPYHPARENPYRPGSMVILEVPTSPVMLDGNLDSLLAFQGEGITKLELIFAVLTCKVQGRPLVIYLHPGHMADLPNEPSDYRAGGHILSGFDSALTFLEVFNIRYLTMEQLASAH